MRDTRGLRVLMQMRPDFREKPGGDVVQLEELLPHLREAGLTVEITGEERPDLTNWDLVHTINLDRPEEPYRHCLNALAQDKPVVLSPVHTDLREFLEWGSPEYWDLPDPALGVPRPRPAPPATEVQQHEYARRQELRQAVVDWSTVYLPNAQLDADYLHRAFGMDPKRTVIVPHGIRPFFAEAPPEPFLERYGRSRFRGLRHPRVEARKNQLALIAALRGTGLPLVIVGQPNPEEYRELCRRYADEHVLFLDALPQRELASVFAAAKVHALVSWYEVPGLVSLEAGTGGMQYRLHRPRLSPRLSQGHGLVLQPRGRGFHSRGRARRLCRAPRRTLAALHSGTLSLGVGRGGHPSGLSAGGRAVRATLPGRARRRRAADAFARHTVWLERVAADRAAELEILHAYSRSQETRAENAESWAKTMETQAQSLEKQLEAVSLELQRNRDEITRLTSRRLYRGELALARLARKLRLKR